MDKEKFMNAGLADLIERLEDAWREYRDTDQSLGKVLREAAAALRGERGDGLIAGDDTADRNGWIDRREGEFTKPLYTRPLSGEQAVRDAVIEECARVCVERTKAYAPGAVRGEVDEERDAEALACAKDIRALKDAALRSESVRAGVWPVYGIHHDYVDRGDQNCAVCGYHCGDPWHDTHKSAHAPGNEGMRVLHTTPDNAGPVRGFPITAISEDEAPANEMAEMPEPEKLPPCMIPDGGDCCPQYVKLRREVEELKLGIAGLEEELREVKAANGQFGVGA
jgi:hypothetical protein